MASAKKTRFADDDDMADGTTLEDLVVDNDYKLGGASSERARAEAQGLLQELDRKRKARSLAVPTDDGRVRARLREIGEPITLFGERAPDRRDRLKYVLSQIQVARGGEALEDESSEESDEDEEEEFYTDGTSELLESRRRIAEFSLPRAQKRIAQQREESRFPLSRIIDLRKRVFTGLKSYGIIGSQIGDDRAISQVRFAPDGVTLATGSWSGNVKLWNIPSCNNISVLRGHSDRVGGVAWHPEATLSQSPDVVNLISGAGEADIHLWSLKGDKVGTLKGHQDRVCRVAFHPSGLYAGSASFDGTWRLWDITTQKELLLQEGHSKEVYAVQFQDDGALSASGGLDGIGRVWDLRTGRTAMVLDGHAQGIYSIDFSPNGYQIATGSGDDTLRIWDMRSLRALHTIPAHKSTVSDVRFFRRHHSSIPKDLDMTGAEESEDDRFTAGLYLISAGYDGLVKIWSADDWQLIRALATDAGKVMSVDIAAGGKYIASGSWNRSYQLFAPE